MIGHLSTFLHHRTSRATGLIFASSGILLGAWAALIPYVKQKFGLDEAELGLLLLSMPAGVTMMNPFAASLLNRFGAARTTLVSLVFTGLFFVLPAAVPTVWLLVPSLFLAGAAFSSTNVAMNTCASLLEQRAGLRIMSTCHGLWSTGAVVGSALAGLTMSWGIAPVFYMGALAVFEIGIVFLLKKPLFAVPDDHLQAPDTPREKTAGFVIFNKALWVLITISLCVNLTEGTMADWSAVYMREVVKSPEAMAGWGFAVYAFFMAGGRFLGDALIARFNSKIVLRTCGSVVAFGLTVAVLAPGMALTLFGFACVGAGVSLGSPILYAAAARVPGMAKGAGLATMNTFAMAGFLGGPVFIGFFAKIFSLTLAFGVVAVFAMVWVWKAGKMQ